MSVDDNDKSSVSGKKYDIFDKVMALPVINIFEPFYKKHREGLLYLFFGGLTTLLNLLLSAFFWYVLKWESWMWDAPFGRVAIGTFVGNLLSILICMVFAYVTNRVYVFASDVYERAEIIKEFLKFAGGRTTTLIIEIGGVQLATILFPGDSVLLFVAKLITQVIVIVLNFIFSKLIVFKNHESDTDVT